MINVSYEINGVPIDQVRADLKAATAIIDAESDKFLRMNTALNDAKKQALISCGQLIEKERQRNDHPFPRDPDQFVFFEKNRGRERRRRKDNVEDWNPYYMRVPWRFRWISEVGSDEEAVKAAAAMAYSMLLRIAPIWTGRYKRVASVYLNDRPTTFTSLNSKTLSTTDLVYVSSQPARPEPSQKNFGYANVLEYGYYTGKYKRHPNLTKARGVLRPIARAVRNEFGDRISARFEYRSNPVTKGSFPVITIAFADQIAQADSIPGKSWRITGKSYGRRGR